MSANTNDWRRELAADVLGVTYADMIAQPYSYVDDYNQARDMAYEEDKAGPEPWQYFDEDAATWTAAAYDEAAHP